MIDAALVVREALLADPVSDEVDGIYAYVIPQGAVPPLILVIANSSNPLARPTTEWWEHLVSIDVQAELIGDSLGIASTITEMVSTIVGADPNGVVVDCQVESVSSVVDDGWTPTRFRQVVSVTLTAREP